MVVASGCTCIGSDKGCEGLKCNKGTDVYAWGQNNYKQVDGISADSIQEEPAIVPYFFKMKPKLVAHVAVC